MGETPLFERRMNIDDFNKEYINALAINQMDYKPDYKKFGCCNELSEKNLEYKGMIESRELQQASVTSFDFGSESNNMLGNRNEFKDESWHDMWERIDEPVGQQQNFQFSTGEEEKEKDRDVECSRVDRLRGVIMPALGIDLDDNIQIDVISVDSLAFNSESNSMVGDLIESAQEVRERSFVCEESVPEEQGLRMFSGGEEKEKDRTEETPGAGVVL